MQERNSVFWTQMNAAQRRLLQMSVHLNPLMVAHADGKLSMRETGAFAASIRSLLTDEAYRPLIVLAGSDAIDEAALNVLLQEHSQNIEAYLQEVAELLEILPTDSAEAYRKFTLFAIVKVAEATRDGLFGLLGERICQSEKKVMRRMVEVLRLEPDDETCEKLGVGRGPSQG